MTNKELVADLLTRLPDDVSLQQIAREIEFIAGVKERLAQLDRGEGVTIARVEKLIAAGLADIKASRVHSHATIRKQLGLDRPR